MSIHQCTSVHRRTRLDLLTAWVNCWCNLSWQWLTWTNRRTACLQVVVTLAIISVLLSFFDEVWVIGTCTKQIERVGVTAINWRANTTVFGYVFHISKQNIKAVRHICQVPGHDCAFILQATAVVGVVVKALEHVICVGTRTSMVWTTGASDRIWPERCTSITRDDCARWDDVIVHLQPSQVPAQTLASRPRFKRFTNLWIITISLITTVSTSILIQHDRPIGSRDGVVVHFRIRTTWDTNARTRAFNNVWCDDSPVWNLIKDRCCRVDEEVVDNFCFDTAFITPDTRCTIAHIIVVASWSRILWVINHITSERKVLNVRDFYLRNSTPRWTDWTVSDVICRIVLCKDIVFKCCIVCTVGSCAITTVADEFIINNTCTLCISIETDWGALRKDGVLDDWATTIYHDHTGPNLIFGQFTIPGPAL